MPVVDYFLPENPGKHRICGRECIDGSPCYNLVEIPGEPCHLDSHQDAARIDDGPSSPDEVPFSGAAPFDAILGSAKTLAFLLVSFIGLSGALGQLVGGALGIVLFLAVMLAIDWWQRRAVG